MADNTLLYQIMNSDGGTMALIEATCNQEKIESIMYYVNVPMDTVEDLQTFLDELTNQGIYYKRMYVTEIY